MKNFTKLGLALFAVICFTGCANIYETPDAEMLAQRHKEIAILPPTVNIAAQKKVSAEAIENQEKNESTNFQQEIYNWMLKRKSKGQMAVKLMSVQKINAQIEKMDVDPATLSPAEFCEKLGVDGVIVSNFNMDKPMSEGGAVALAVLTGFGASTNKVNATLEIHDMDEDKMIWRLQHDLSAGIGSSPGELVESLMRYASKKMPYKI